jgi:SpoVK/Ycf46/Vps4 family AAA+-type ATPase
VRSELGILSDGRNIVIGAQDLIGDAVGVSETNVKELFARAEGKVVIIDEAYAFDDSGYGKDVINSMLT